jgi:hypothetical protein
VIKLVPGRCHDRSKVKRRKAVDTCLATDRFFHTSDLVVVYGFGSLFVTPLVSARVHFQVEETEGGDRYHRMRRKASPSQATAAAAKYSITGRLRQARRPEALAD